MYLPSGQASDAGNSHASWETACQKIHGDFHVKGGWMNLRILLIMDPLIAVPPQHYGGIERVIADLANGLHRRGHQVTLWAAPGSSIQGKVVPFGRESEWTRWSNIRNTIHLSSRLWRLRGKFDLIHNFGRLAY